MFLMAIDFYVREFLERARNVDLLKDLVLLEYFLGVAILGFAKKVV